MWVLMVVDPSGHEMTEEGPMKTLFAKFAIGSLTATLVVFAGGAVGATGTTLPPGTTVTVGLESGHVFEIYLRSNGLPETISYNTFSAEGTVKETSLSTLVISNPVVDGCYTSLGPSVQVTTNSRHGHWKLSDSSGPTMELSIPQAGFKLAESRAPGSCVPTANPHSGAEIAGACNSQNLDTITKQHLAVSRSPRCENKDLSIPAAIVLSPNPGDLPPW